MALFEEEKKESSLRSGNDVLLTVSAFHSLEAFAHLSFFFLILRLNSRVTKKKRGTEDALREDREIKYEREGAQFAQLARRHNKMNSPTPHS